MDCMVFLRHSASSSSGRSGTPTQLTFALSVLRARGQRNLVRGMAAGDALLEAQLVALEQRPHDQSASRLLSSALRQSEERHDSSLSGLAGEPGLVPEL